GFAPVLKAAVPAGAIALSFTSVGRANVSPLASAWRRRVPCRVLLLASAAFASNRFKPSISVFCEAIVIVLALMMVCSAVILAVCAGSDVGTFLVIVCNFSTVRAGSGRTRGDADI